MRRWTVVILLISSAAAAQAPRLAQSSGCSGAIARYRAVQENDLAMGHVSKSVYAQIKREIEDADKVCATGQDSKATAMIRASQTRHGYPTGI